MGKSSAVVSGALALALLCSSCASSERMMRMSGDVFSSYSAPKSDRLKGMKSVPRLADRPRPRRTLGGEINLWPFFFRHRDYWNALWPMIDRDDYGFAVRPFYVQEGREKTILFPLTAWNDESGWVLNAYWGPGFFGFPPLFHYSENFSYYGPWWQGKGAYGFFPLGMAGPEGGYAGPVYWGRDPEKETFKHWGFIPLVHWGKDFRYVFPTLSWWNSQGCTAFWVPPLFLHISDLVTFVGPVWWAQNDSWGVFPLWYWKSPEENFLLPLYYKEENAFYSIPFSRRETKDEKTLSVLGPLYWHSAGPKGEFTLAGGLFYRGKENYGTEENYYGIAPFFHRSTSEAMEKFNLLWILFHFERRLKGTDYRSPGVKWIVPVLLGGGKWDRLENEVVCLALLSGFSRRFTRSGIWRELDFSPMTDAAPLSRAYRRIRIAEMLKKQGIDLPPGLRTRKELFSFAEQLEKEGKLPLELRSVSHGFLPLWLYSWGARGYDFTLPCLLTHWEGGKLENSWQVLPLLSWGKDSACETERNFLWPLYGESETRLAGRIVEKATLTEADPDHALRFRKVMLTPFCRTGEGTFAVPRRTGGAARLNAALGKIEAYRSAAARYRKLKHEYDEKARLLRLAAKEVKEKLPPLDDAKKLAASNIYEVQTFGRLLNSLGKARRTKEKLAAELGKACASLELKFTPEDPKAMEKALREKHTAQVEVSRVRSLLFRSDAAPELRKWSVLWLLLRSETTTDREHFSVLEFLYRHRREGKRSSTLCFPFITVERDGEDHSWSFLYRLLKFGRKGGRDHGYIFFIPFGGGE